MGANDLNFALQSCAEGKLLNEIYICDFSVVEITFHAKISTLKVLKLTNYFLVFLHKFL